MKHNAFTTQPVTLQMVWGDTNVHLPYWTLLPDTPVMVIWSPVFRQYIMSITTSDYRYDAFVHPSTFRADGSLSVDGPSYYLEQAKTAANKIEK